MPLPFPNSSQPGVSSTGRSDGQPGSCSSAKFGGRRREPAGRAAARGPCGTGGSCGRHTRTARRTGPGKGRARGPLFRAARRGRHGHLGGLTEGLAGRVLAVTGLRRRPPRLARLAVRSGRLLLPSALRVHGPGRRQRGLTAASSYQWSLARGRARGSGGFSVRGLAPAPSPAPLPRAQAPARLLSPAAPAVLSGCSQVKSYYRPEDFSITPHPIKAQLACETCRRLRRGGKKLL